MLISGFGPFPQNGIPGKTPPAGNHFLISTVVLVPTAREPYLKRYIFRCKVYFSFTGGSLTLNSSDPFDKPIINPKYLGSELDMFIMREAIRSAQRFVEAPVFKGYLDAGLYKGRSRSDEELNEFIRTNTTNLHHPVGTAAMSARNADFGVVDPDLRVKGVSGLRVVDSSVFVSSHFWICFPLPYSVFPVFSHLFHLPP